MIPAPAYICGEMDAVGQLIPDGRPYIYASVNTLRHKPLLLERHLAFAAASYEALYGKKPALDAEKIREAIASMLASGGFPATGNIVDIFLLPTAGDVAPSVAIQHSRTTLYRGYELLSLKAKAVITNYDIPFESHRTSISRMAAAYMDDFAVRREANIALRANRAGNLIASGDYPLFAVLGGELLTPPIGHGIGNSVERQLMFEACASARIPVREEDIALSALPKIEEIMVFTASGIQNILSCNDIYFPNLLGLRLEKHLPTLRLQ